MRRRHHAKLVSIARRVAGSAGAEDAVQDAYLAAVKAGRIDFSDPTTLNWLAGAVRNTARMHARAARRRRDRERDWHGLVTTEMSAASPLPPELPSDLPVALRAVAVLVVTGHTRREIAYLLGISDTALRQRVAALKRRLTASGLAAPSELRGLNLDLAYGRIRSALLPAIALHGALFASHDPDGHLFFVTRSQTTPRRQLDGAKQEEASP